MSGRTRIGIAAAAVGAIVFLVWWGAGDRVGRTTRRTATRTVARPAAAPLDAPPAVNAPVQPGSIHLEVVDSRDQKSVADVDLVLLAGSTPLEAPFEKEGDAWNAAELAPGAYLLTAGARSYGPSSTQVNVAPGKRTSVRIRLLRNLGVGKDRSPRDQRRKGGSQLSWKCQLRSCGLAARSPLWSPQCR